MTTDPGQVPVFWGFHLGDPENKRRRYCLMCNIFKPERCHHCSACNRCVLNMDHHCPWINNCIGFWNRKFFILLLIYVFIITYFNSGEVTTFPKFIYVAAARGVPAEANVIASAVFIATILLVLIVQINGAVKRKKLLKVK